MHHFQKLIYPGISKTQELSSPEEHPQEKNNNEKWNVFDTIIKYKYALNIAVNPSDA